jgi:ribonucleotide reductase alpha subunit
MSNIEIPWGPVGYISYKRTYARRLKDADPNSPTEEWEQTVDRVVEACDKQLKVGFTPKEQKRLKEIMLQLKGTVAGRFLWQLGTKTVKKLGLASLQNCAFTVVDHPIRPFTWCMDMLMLGSGVGYNIQKEYVYELPKPKKVKVTRKDSADADFIVPDSREGWVELLKKTLEAHYVTGKGFSYSTICIRSKGSPIKGFGGSASGPDELCWGIEEINKLLNNRAGKKVRPIDCLDIMNIIGKIVVAGNVRRSAQIAIGDMDDLQFLNAKRWDLGNIPNWRAMSNNSIVCNDISQLPVQFWEGYKGNGEPYGLINLRNSQRMGRIDETQYPDPEVLGFNPCQPSFATVLTKDGIKTFNDISIGDFIWSKEGWTKIVNKWSTGVKPVFEYKTSSGSFVGTENHRLVTKQGKVEAKFCKEVHVISGPLAEKPEDFMPEQIRAGQFIGNDYCKKEVTKIYGNENTSLLDYCNKLNKLELLSFLRGLYSANGTVVKQKDNSVKVSYKTTSKKLAEELQLVLSSLGIRSYITTNKSTSVEFYSGEEFGKEYYDVNITKDFREFYSRIGFLQEYEMQKMREALELYKPNDEETFAEVREVNYLGEHEVYDITVDNASHTYWTGGLDVSNCAEQSLAPYETCCLAEIFLPNIESKEELLEVATYLYRINKHSLALGCHLEETETIVHKNMRMGIGVTGYMQASKKQKSWLPEVYEQLRIYDRKYSAKHDFPTSIKLTTVKPSGTLSLLAGVTPGAHPGYSHYHIRRIRMASNIPLVELCRKAGYPVEYQRNFDGSNDMSTVVVSFPCKFPNNTIVAKDMTAVDQLEVVKELQSNWSDNAVSVTIYYKKEELEDIKQWLYKNYNNSVKTCSFLLHSEHGFDQAPLEEITEEQYQQMVKNCKPISKIEEIDEQAILDSFECEGGVCPVK